MSPIRVIVTVLVLTIVGGITPLLIAFLVARRMVGPRVAMQRLLILLPFLFITLLIGFLLFYFLPETWHSNGWAFFQIAFAVFICSFLVYLLYRRRQAGRLLLDLGHPRGHKFLLMISISSIMLALAAFALALVDSGFQFATIARLIFFSSLGALNAIFATSRIQVREHGLVVSADMLPWHKITGYHWEPDHPHTLTLHVQTTLPWFQRPSIPIPPVHHDHVNTLLTRYIHSSGTPQPAK